MPNCLLFHIVFAFIITVVIATSSGE